MNAFSHYARHAMAAIGAFCMTAGLLFASFSADPQVQAVAGDDRMTQLDRRPAGGAPGKFRLDKVDGKLLGVCSGLANYLNVSPLTVRLVFVLGTLIGFGSFILIYLAIALLAD